MRAPIGNRGAFAWDAAAPRLWNGVGCGETTWGPSPFFFLLLPGLVQLLVAGVGVSVRVES
jgi:hypothetical protein